MDDYTHGDIVVMNRDYNGCYEGEKLTYVRPDELPNTSVLKNIRGEISFIATDAFDLRDKPEFKRGDLVTGVKGSFCEGVDLLFHFYTEIGCIASNSGGRALHFDTSDIIRQPDVRPEFEIGEIIEVSNHEDFELFDQVYFVADASKVKSYDGDYPIVTASDMGTIQNYKYARKIVEKTYTIKHDCIEYPATKEQHDRYQVLIAEVTA